AAGAARRLVVAEGDVGERGVAAGADEQAAAQPGTAAAGPGAAGATRRDGIVDRQVGDRERADIVEQAALAVRVQGEAVADDVDRVGGADGDGRQKIAGAGGGGRFQ